MDLMGLGIRLDLQDNMTREIDPLIRRLDELESQSRQTAHAFNHANDSMFGARRRRNILDHVSSMGQMDVALNRISRTLISATASANSFATATNRMQFAGNFNRMYGEMFRVNRMISNMGFGMSRLQREMSDTRAYNIMNYQMKDLHDRIKLTTQAIQQMQRSPDSSRFREQIALAQASLSAYQSQLMSTEAMQQRLAATHNLRTFNAGGSQQLMQMPESRVQRFANRMYGSSMLDVAHASNLAYRSLDRTGRMMVGNGYTTMERRQQLNQRLMPMQMAGQIASMYMTLPILIGAGLVIKFIDSKSLNQGLDALSKTFKKFLVVSGIVKQVDALGESLKRLSATLNQFMDDHPKMTKIIGLTAELTLGFLALLGPILFMTSALVRYRSVIQGVSHALFGLSKGGFAVLSPQAQMASKNMRAFMVAIARFPQTLLTTIPLLYNFIRLLPTMAVRIAMMNPLMTTLGIGILAYTKNWWGLKDTVNGYIDDMKKKWQELVEVYQNSALPKTLQTLKEYAKSFGKGFFDGLGIAVDIGKEFVNFVLVPIKAIVNQLSPFITSFANSVSEMFGGKGNLQEGKQTWEAIGKAMGMIVGGLLALKGVMVITTLLVSPFRRMATAVTGVTSAVDRLIVRMGALASTTVGRVGGTIGGLASGTAGVIRSGASSVGRFIFGSGGNNAVTGSPNILQRTGRLLTSPFRFLGNALASPLSYFGIGSGTAIARQRAELRASGMALRNNPALLNAIRANGTMGISANGTHQGTQVFQGRRNALMRALFGQRLYSYTPTYDRFGRISGLERDHIGTTGGLFRRNDMTAGGQRANFIQRALGGTRYFLDRTMGGTFDRMTNGMLTPFRAGFDRFTGSRFARGFANVGGSLANRLTLAGVRNPFAGALRTTNVTGDALSRRARMGNFMRTVASGTGGMIMGGVRGTGRGIARVGRGVGAVGRGALATTRFAGRVATAPMRLAGRAMGGLMALAPWLMIGGLAGSLAYNKLGKGKDGKKSVDNIAGNLDKLTAGIGKSGGKGITQFWNRFKKVGGDILKAVGRLIAASLKSLAPKIPGMLKDAWNGIVALAKWAWNWIKTDGVKMASAMGKGLMSVLGSAWKWIKTEGVKYLGMALQWLIGTGLPLVVKGIGKLITWIVGTALPGLLKFAWDILKKLWTWFTDDGYKQLWSLVKGVGTVALEIGKAIFNGIKSALSGLGDWIVKQIGKLPGGEKILSFFGAKKHARGGILNSPHMGIVAEDGAEAIIPLTKKGIGVGLLKQTASILGYDITPQGKQMSPQVVNRGGSVQDFINQSKTKPLVRNSNGVGNGQTDNSFKIEKVEIKMDGSNLPNGKADLGEARKQAQFFMKELRKVVLEEKKRNKGKSFEEILLSYV